MSAPNWEDVVILAGQLASQPLGAEAAVQLKTVIGRSSRRPLKLGGPVVAFGKIGEALPENPAEPIKRILAVDTDLAKADAVVISPPLAAVKSVWDLLVLVQKLRDLTGGKPIGLKIVAGKIEDDMAWVRKSTADFVIIESRDLPLVFALYRARKFLNDNEIENVDLVAAGDLKTPSDIVKAMALGASAAALDLPTGKKADEFLRTLNLELARLVRTVGKDDIHELAPADLATTTREISDFTNIKHV
ncbi:MAG: hypothetical protein LBU20_02090 [Candidatus Nomurabacteria bacterium]|jgi:hypothetical protein|nr:hypothetical protein [Candidatus Nomurabacteria bacterium]